MNTLNLVSILYVHVPRTVGLDSIPTQQTCSTFTCHDSHRVFQRVTIKVLSFYSGFEKTIPLCHSPSPKGKGPMSFLMTSVLRLLLRGCKVISLCKHFLSNKICTHYFYVAMCDFKSTQCFFFLFNLMSLSRLFHSYRDEPIGRWG